VVPGLLQANVCTGLVNLSVRTHCVGDGAAIVILAVYMAAVLGVGVALDAYGVAIK
jgi:hypothetical protein